MVWAIAAEARVPPLTSSVIMSRVFMGIPWVFGSDPAHHIENERDDEYGSEKAAADVHEDSPLLDSLPLEHQ
jgi:hypothetical protein